MPCAVAADDVDRASGACAAVVSDTGPSSREAGAGARFAEHGTSVTAAFRKRWRRDPYSAQKPFPLPTASAICTLALRPRLSGTFCAMRFCSSTVGKVVRYARHTLPPLHKKEIARAPRRPPAKPRSRAQREPPRLKSSKPLACEKCGLDGGCRLVVGLRRRCYESDKRSNANKWREPLWLSSMSSEAGSSATSGRRAGTKTSGSTTPTRTGSRCGFIPTPTSIR